MRYCDPLEPDRPQDNHRETDVMMPSNIYFSTSSLRMAMTGPFLFLMEMVTHWGGPVLPVNDCREHHTVT